MTDKDAVSDAEAVLDEVASEEIVLDEGDVQALLQNGSRVIHLHTASVTLKLDVDSLPGGLTLTPETLQTVMTIQGVEEEEVESEEEAPPEPVTGEAITRIIEYGWQHYNSYDMRSFHLKVNYQRIRRFIILITWFTTLMSVLNGYVSDMAAGVFSSPVAVAFSLQVVYVAVLVGAVYWIGRKLVARQGSRRAFWDWRAFMAVFRKERRLFFLLGLAIVLLIFQEPIFDYGISRLGDEGTTRTFFQLFLVVLPLVSTGYWGFASRFESGVTWVGFRQAAEAIKRKIFTLRVRRGEVGELTSKDLKGLTDVISNVRETLEAMSIDTPLMGNNYTPGEKLIMPDWAEPGDDSYSPMSLDQYVQWRVVPEANWHRGRIKRDYQKSRFFRSMIIVAGLSGSFLAAFQLGQFVAVSVAGSAALAAYLTMMQYEQTYNIYENTIRDLDDALSDYYVRLKAISEQEEKSEADKAEIETFVLHVEEILEEQRERTGVSQLQAQADAEASLSQLVNSGGPSGADIDHLVRDIDDIDSD